MNAVETVEQEVGLADVVEDLRNVKGFWKQLQALRKKALADAKVLPRYRKLLEQGVTQARATRAENTVPDDATQDAQCKAWWASWNAFEAIPGREPAEWPLWVEKWLPETWNKFTAAVNAFVSEATKRNFDRLRTITGDMMRAYVIGQEVGRSEQVG